MKEFKKIAASYGRSFLASCLAVYFAGVTDPKAILGAGLAAVLPPLLRWLNPVDTGFGVKGK